MQKVYTAGIVPDYEDFITAYNEKFGEDQPFEVKDDKYVGSETYVDADDLYDAVLDAYDSYSCAHDREESETAKPAEDFVHTVLITLVFEWV